jgi:hypothetical protein
MHCTSNSCCQTPGTSLLCYFLRNAVNHAPSFKAGAATITVAEDSGAYSAAWATNISAGPGESDPLAFTVNCSAAPAALFAVEPAADAAGRLTFTPAADNFGNASCTVTLTEQMAGGMSAAAPLTIVVTPGEFATIDARVPDSSLSHSTCVVTAMLCS